jgi:hypothetical protein
MGGGRRCRRSRPIPTLLNRGSIRGVGPCFPRPNCSRKGSPGRLPLRRRPQPYGKCSVKKRAARGVVERLPIPGQEFGDMPYNVSRLSTV